MPGFTLSHPDGSQDVYAFMVTNSSGTFQQAFLTERRNAQSQKTLLNYAGYTPGTSPTIRLLSVVDGDGRTNRIYYASTNAFSTNCISQVVDAFGRTNFMKYDSNGYLTNITDVAGISSSFTYNTNGWVTSMTTPYGTTGFTCTDTSGTAPNGRSVLVSEPDGSHQLYVCADNAPGIASSYASGEVPVTSPFTNTLDNSALNVRNTFHWDRQQYVALSTTNISALSTNDYRLARMKHWLKSDSTTLVPTLSLERAPSPDGTAEGEKVWYDYAGKTTNAYPGTQASPLLVAQVLPDGTTRFTRTERNSFGAATNEVSTWSAASGVALRTNTFTFAANEIDLLTVTNASGVQASSNVYNAYHQVLTNFNALGEQTVFTYDTNQQLTSISRPTGLTTTNVYFTAGGDVSRLDKTIDLEIGRTNAYTYYGNGLIYARTDERGLTTTNYWDDLQRLTGVSYPDGSSSSNIYTALDLTAAKDRSGNWTYFGYDAVRRNIAVTNANGVVTRYGYCDCGALLSITNAWNTSVQAVTGFNYDYQGNRTYIFGPDGYNVANWFNALGQLPATAGAIATSITTIRGCSRTPATPTARSKPPCMTSKTAPFT